jgi:hypothetical protein
MARPAFIAFSGEIVCKKKPLEVRNMPQRLYFTYHIVSPGKSGGSGEVGKD